VRPAGRTHYDKKGAFEKRLNPPEKDAAKDLSSIIDKVGRYFGEYEIGVDEEVWGKKGGTTWKVKPTKNTIDYLKAMNAQGKHIFIRPTFDNEDRFMLHDDLDQKHQRAAIDREVKGFVEQTVIRQQVATNDIKYLKVGVAQAPQEQAEEYMKQI
jgi:hypothetical protein